MTHGRTAVLLCAGLLVISGCVRPRAATGDGAASSPPYTAFKTPQRVTLQGYAGDAMEPFFTKDGRYLLFNNRNDPSVNTDLHYARRIDGLNFRYMGGLRGVNTPALEGVPSMDRQGELYFVSTRSYDSTLSTIYRGHFRDGDVTAVEIVPGVSMQRRGFVNFDAEISADGNTLLVVDGDFTGDPKPSAATIAILTRSGQSFRRTADSATILRRVNAGGLNYAPCLSVDGLELFFTRVPKITPGARPGIYRAARKSATEPFGEPQPVAAISGFVEGPTLSADGKTLSYHKMEANRYVLYRVQR